MPSFQNRLFNNPNFITLNEREIKKNLPFHVNKEIDYSIIRINYIGIHLRLVSQIFVVVTYNINLALNRARLRSYSNYSDRRPSILNSRKRRATRSVIRRFRTTTFFPRALITIAAASRASRWRKSS